MKDKFFVPMLEAIRRIIGGHLSNPPLVVPVAKVKVELTMPALHLVASSVARVFGEKLKVDGTINEVSPFFSLAESTYRGYWTDAKENLSLLMENVTERLRPILEEEKPELLRAVRRVGKVLLDRLSERIVSRYWVERTLRELAEALDQAYCEAFRIVKGEGKTAGGSLKSYGEESIKAAIILCHVLRNVVIGAERKEEAYFHHAKEYLKQAERKGYITPQVRDAHLRRIDWIMELVRKERVYDAEPETFAYSAMIGERIALVVKELNAVSSEGSEQDPYLDYIEELKRYKISTFHSLRAHRYTEMIKALPDFEPVPYYTYEVEPETLREALGWINRESFRNLLAHKIIYKDDVWRIKERLTLPEFTVLANIAGKHDITVEVIEETR